MNRSFGMTWVLFFVPALVWGFSFQMMKWGLLAFSSYQLSSLRIMVAAVAVSPLAFFYAKGLHRKDLFWVILLYVFNTLVPFFLFCLAETKVDASTAGILNSFTPLWTLLIGVLVFQHQLKRTQLVAVLLGFASISLIIFSEYELKSTSVLYSSLILFATFSYAISVWVVQKKLSHMNAFSMTTFGLFFAGIVSAVIFCSTDMEKPFHHEKIWVSLGAVFFLGILGTALVGLMFNQLIKKNGAVFASMVTYCIPLVSIVVSWTMGEKITVWVLIGILGILVSIYLSKYRGKKEVHENINSPKK